MSLEDLETKIRWAGEEAWHKGNVDAFGEVYAEDYVWHRPPLPDIKGLEAAKQSVVGARAGSASVTILEPCLATHRYFVGKPRDARGTGIDGKGRVV